MKLKIDVEIDWLDEDGSLDDSVKSQLASQILKKVNDESIQSLTKNVEGLMQAKVDTLVTDTFKSIMSQEVAITDNWGSVVKSYPNVDAMIKARFDDFMIERVDSDGRKSTYGDSTRLDLIIRKQLDKTAKEFTTSAVKEVTETIKATLSKDLKDQLGDRLMNLMEIDTILNSKKLKA